MNEITYSQTSACVRVFETVDKSSAMSRAMATPPEGGWKTCMSHQMRCVRLIKPCVHALNIIILIRNSVVRHKKDKRPSEAAKRFAKQNTTLKHSIQDSLWTRVCRQCSEDSFIHGSYHMTHMVCTALCSVQFLFLDESCDRKIRKICLIFVGICLSRDTNRIVFDSIFDVLQIRSPKINLWKSEVKSLLEFGVNYISWSNAWRLISRYWNIGNWSYVFASSNYWTNRINYKV